MGPNMRASDIIISAEYKKGFSSPRPKMCFRFQVALDDPQGDEEQEQWRDRFFVPTLWDPVGWMVPRKWSN
jgi:hypothetical protein